MSDGVYRHLTKGQNLYCPPTPATGVPILVHQNLEVGQDVPSVPPARHPDFPSNPLAYVDQNRRILVPGEQSLHEHHVNVWDELTPKHIGVAPDTLTFSRNHHTTGQRTEYNDAEVMTHHSGQRVRYKIDPVSGMYLYRGYVYEPHFKDPPMLGSANYVTSVDRGGANMYQAPHPTTQLDESNPRKAPAPYNVDNAQLWKPLPDNFTASHRQELTHSNKAHPTHPGRARYDHTLSINK